MMAHEIVITCSSDLTPNPESTYYPDFFFTKMSLFISEISFFEDSKFVVCFDSRTEIKTNSKFYEKNRVCIFRIECSI